MRRCLNNRSRQAGLALELLPGEQPAHVDLEGQQWSIWRYQSAEPA